MSKQNDQRIERSMLYLAETVFMVVGRALVGIGGQLVERKQGRLLLWRDGGQSTSFQLRFWGR